LKDHAGFLKDFRSSITAVNTFAAILRTKGVQVWLPPTQVTPDFESRMEYADSGDMMIHLRAEHKVRNLKFTCREDFPYPTLIIDEKYKVDSKADSPLLAYFIQSEDGQCVACVYGHTKHRWQVEPVYDKLQGRTCHNYTIPIQFVRFCKPEEIFS
jgi:hypothetical protein